MQSLGGEFAIRGDDLLAWNPVLVDNMAKKGKSFKSGWVEYIVCLHQNMLYYYRDMREVPSGCLCLDGCVIEAVDRIFKNMSPGDSHILAEECGPCFKVTSRMGRSLLFRTRNKESRVQWIHMLQDMSYDALFKRMQHATKEKRELLQQVHDTNAAVTALHSELAALREQYDALLAQETSSSRRGVTKSVVSSPPIIVLDSPDDVLPIVVAPPPDADSNIRSNHPSTSALSKAEPTPTSTLASITTVNPPRPVPPSTIDTDALTKMTSELAGIARNLQLSLFSQPSNMPATTSATTADLPTAATEERHHPSHRMMMSAMEKIIFDMELEDELQRTRNMLTGGKPSSTFSPNPPLYQSFLATSSATAAVHRDPLTTPIVLLAESPSAFRQIKGDDAGIQVMALLFPLLRIFGSRHALFMLMQWSIDTEVESALSLATLFRSDDYSSRLLSTYAKAVGLRFIHTALADHIRALCTDKATYHSSDFELNVVKDPTLTDPAKLERNAANLMAVCQTIVDSILTHMDDLPLSFVHVCRYLKDKLIERFLDTDDDYDGSSTPIKAIMGGFLFLRFICPAITTPHSYGLLDQVPDASSRRILVLVTKLLFNCSTDVEFGVKEAYMRVVNGFIVENAPRMAFLYTRLTAKRDGEVEQCFTADSDGIFARVAPDQLAQDLHDVVTALGKHVDDVQAKVAVASAPLAAQLHALVCPSSSALEDEVVLPVPEEKLKPKGAGMILNFFKKSSGGGGSFTASQQPPPPTN
ncbi:hypothetical protein B5M09_006059 [Aphanomyces astaci]|uniref:Ras-GAP domain-containing protein n=1 Tax=Aphanomyces astaci TaxID=112090 RepID=A0A425DEH4_APHAT|nr:hypothetical protein B5M09_006059 [Aphanomyces astaci]